MLPGKNKKIPLTKPKSPQELRNIKKAVWIVSRVLREMEIPFGRTERDVAGEIRRRIYGYNARPSFRPIVATGRNTGFVHHKPGNRIIRREKPLLMDLGARFLGQCSDITRMYIPAKSLFRNPIKRRPLSDDSIWKIYRDALDIQKKIMGRIKPGMEFRELNELYKRMMERKGYKVKHSIGHGIGLHIHERIKELKPGMVLTVEPGIYMKEFGCRVEDMILIKRRSIEILSDSIPKSLDIFLRT